jgi:glyoxylase I family protein
LCTRTSCATITRSLIRCHRSVLLTAPQSRTHRHSQLLSRRPVSDWRDTDPAEWFAAPLSQNRQLTALNRSPRLGSVQRMPIRLENVGIAVRDLEATIAFFTDLGLTVLGRDTVSGEWTDTAVGLDGNHANIAMLQTPDGNGRLELFEYIHPDAIETKPTRPNEIGMHRVAFSVDDIDEALEIAARHGCHPLRGVATYEDAYKLTYVRGPSGIIVMLAEALNKS